MALHFSSEHDRINKITAEGGIAVNPRIFISSTFYDLQYAREDLGNFISGFGFEAIRSESGSIGYTPGVELDESCYAAMRESDMAVLIVGGRYGSPVSGEKPGTDGFKKFTSITRREFNTAVEHNVPVFIFIKEDVYNEYQLFKRNKKEIEDSALTLKFVAVDHINVFRFIDDIQLTPKMPVFSFKSISEIKNILKLQWADMFRKYLLSLRQQTSAIRGVEPFISQIYGSLQEMKIMLQKVGEATLADKPQAMEDVRGRQFVENAANKIASAFEFVSSLKDENIHDYIAFFVERLFELKREGLLEYPFSDNLEDEKLFYSRFDYDGVCISLVKDHLAFEEDIFRDSDEFRAQLVDRLSENDYLKKMKFI